MHGWMYKLFNHCMFIPALDTQGAATILRGSVDPDRLLQHWIGEILAPVLVRFCRSGRCIPAR